MSILSSANVTEVNLVLKERTHMRLCINVLIFTHNLGNWLIVTPAYCGMSSMNIHDKCLEDDMVRCDLMCNQKPTRSNTSLSNKPFSPTNGSDHVNTSMKFGSQYGWGEQLNCRMFITLFSYFNMAAETTNTNSIYYSFDSQEATWSSVSHHAPPHLTEHSHAQN